MKAPKRRSGRRPKPSLPWFRRPWSIQGPFASDPKDRTRPEWCNILDANGMFVVEGLAPAMAALIVNAVNAWDSVLDYGPAVVDPSGIRCRVDAEQLLQAIKAGMRLGDGQECRAGSIWVFRDNPVDYGEEPDRAGVIRISTEPPAEVEWEKVEENL